MSTTTTLDRLSTEGPVERPLAPGVSLRGVFASEWVKFRSLRSTFYTLGVAALLTVGLGALVSAVTASNFDRLSAVERAGFDPVSTSLSGVSLAQLAIGVLGVLMFSGEYGTGSIRATLTVVPRRLPVLWAKLGVFAGVVAVTSFVMTLASFVLGQTLLDGEGLGVALGADGTWSAILGASGYLTLAGLIGVCLGALLRSTAAGISTFVGLFFVLPPLAGLLPVSWTEHFLQYLPSSAGASMYGGTMEMTNALSAVGGTVLLAAYAVVMIAAAGVRLTRTDA